MCVISLQTYVIGHQNFSVRITILFLIPLSLCALIERQIFEKLFLPLLFTLRVYARNLLRGSRRRNIFHISFLITQLGYEPRLLRLISRHITYKTTTTQQSPLHPEKVTVWCALWSEDVIGPYFFEDDDGTTVTVNAEHYGHMITNFFCLLLKNTNRRICGDINWPLRSCDLIPLDFFVGLRER